MYKIGRNGLNMIDFKMAVIAFKVKWIKEYFEPNVIATWKANLETFYQIQNLALYFQSNYCLDEVSKTVPNYYLEAIQFW